MRQETFFCSSSPLSYCIDGGGHGGGSKLEIEFRKRPESSRQSGCKLTPNMLSRALLQAMIVPAALMMIMPASWRVVKD
jgi:hypothetical protein